jgi:hypothetical protein
MICEAGENLVPPGSFPCAAHLVAGGTDAASAPTSSGPPAGAAHPTTVIQHAIVTIAGRWRTVE